MMKFHRAFRFSSIALFASLALGAPPTSPAPDSALVLWYEHPATQWVEALPLGNGRLGAMVFGGIQTERFQLNEDTLWAGGPYNPVNPDARAALPEIRRLIAAGEYVEAQKLVDAKFMARPVREAPYQTLGDLIVSMSGSDAAKDYRRELDLDTAIATTTFTIGSVKYTREAFVSPVDQVLVIRLAAQNTKQPERPATLAFTVAATTPQRASTKTEGSADLVLNGVNGSFQSIAGALKFQARVHVTVEGGTVSADENQLHIDGAASAVITVAAATSYRRYNGVSGNPQQANVATLAAAARKPYATLRADHIAEHQRLFHRVAIDLGHSAAEQKPTDQRVRDVPQVADPQLEALYFQYGRYLLLCSSRPGTQPANLQGIWNDSLNPPWGSKYTININTEMNYWPVEATNLAECAEPLFAMIRDLSETGAITARDHYGATGWVAHHNTDAWRATGPVDSAFYGTWPSGGAWLCRHLWEHYLYSGDRKFLAEAYPLMKGAAEFFVATLVEESTHRWLVTSPSMSPENSHHRGASMAAGPTMDIEIVRDLFNACIESSRLLGTDAAFRDKLVATRDRLPPLQIGSQGQLQEWLEDWDAGAPDQHHRHVSHLYGFFPSDQITLRGTPELAAAVRQTLETRGDISTGWAIAWRLNLWARLQDGERAHSILRVLMGPERTYPNLFDAHPPFQIDGNFGGTSAIAEMLLQSHTGEIELLPALPKAWPTGFVKGLRARGGFEVDLAWRDGKLANATVRTANGGMARLRYRTATRQLEFKPQQSATWDGEQ